MHLLIPVGKVGLTPSVPKDRTWIVSPHMNISVLQIFDKSFNTGSWKAGSYQIQMKAREKLICISFTGFHFSRFQCENVSITIIPNSENKTQTDNL